VGLAARFRSSPEIVQQQRLAPSANRNSQDFTQLPGVDAMLVRALRSRQRRPSIRVAALLVFAFAITVAYPRHLLGQQTTLPKTHTVKRGDTLWDIAKLYLGDPFLWPEIYRLNTDVIEDPHWIYPGETLKLPGDTTKVIAAAPAEAAPKPVETPAVVAAPSAPDTATHQQIEEPTSSVRSGEYVAAPWLDQAGGPKGSGYLIQGVDLPGIATADQSRLNLYDKVVLAPPAGGAAPARELYLAYRLGPLIEDLGQVVIPTGVIQVTRSPQNGEGALGRVIKMFGQVEAGQRLIPYDTSAAVAVGHLTPVTNGASGKVRWIASSPVLPSLQHYVVLDISKRNGISTGDQIELFEPRHRAEPGQEYAIPEVSIARAQVLRVTPFGATAIITAQEQPKIQEGTAARIAAKMP
jgi:LysM repeat protein